MKSPNTPLSSTQIEAIEARFALRLSARLDDSAKALPHDITERLRVAREQAVRAAVLVRPQVAVATAPEYVPSSQLAGVSMAGSGSSGVASLSGWSSSGMKHRDKHHGRAMDDGPLPWGWRLASALPALALVVGLWGIHLWSQSEKVQAASDVDMALLTDDLPPAAYADPGFEEYLQTEPPISAEPDVAETDEAAMVDSEGQASDESASSDSEPEAQP
ncbi:DUF3619 family protein [Aquabacterium sp.]|uniref:DUF3619 family protein n=1 Tax=Aquabacterium sp. TaxID=1872578 RepID=UPI00344FCDDF